MEFNINLAVRGTQCAAALEQKMPITTGSRGVFRVVLAADASWDGMDKTVVFRAGQVSKSQHIGIDGTSCLVPPEVLAERVQCMYIGVYGTAGEDLVRTTTWARLYGIVPGAIPTGDALDSPDLYAQLIAQFQAGADAVSEVAALAEGYAVSAVESANQAEQVAAEMQSVSDRLFASAEAAEAAKEAAAAAQDNAERARDAAQTAQKAAETAKAATEQASSDAGATLLQVQALAKAAELAASQAESYYTNTQSLYDAVVLLAQAAEQSATQAENSATAAERARANAESYALHPPVIGDDGLWYLWDGTQYVATDKSSSGLPDVVTLSGAEVSLALANNTEYRCAEAMSSLEITGFEAGPAGKAELWSIVFTAGDTVTVTLPDTVVWAVAEPVFTAGSTYWLTVVPMAGKYLAAWAEVEAG